ncbi:G-patch domain and KOW motifs-containing protein [Onthophagus taurus]|uniref:G-patch domain and KOW motifs-containing protein n=1 Tax=Onthophagus taurus TaxID=166361 RepID=UPI000C1FF6AB|nr:G patch domain and KOW motifs-containing protein [Onthophagus taurus]
MNKKISFGFNKTIKKPTVFESIPTPKSDIQLIDCLEGQSIKVIGEKEEIVTPLIIPLKEDSKNLLDRIKKAANKKHEENILIKPDSELTLDELAAKQLIVEARTNVAQKETKIASVPISADNLPLNGEKESTLEDYESVPIEDFGLAMLRGMGWKDGMTVGKNVTQNLKLQEPELRPKGLGLGATKIVQENKPKIGVDNHGNELKIVKGAFLKIIAGAFKGKYGEVLGLDQETSRVIVKLTISKETISLNEFLVVPVTKQEYEKYSKILNLDQYEEYKSKNDNNPIIYKKDSSSRRSSRSSSESSDYKRKHSSNKKKDHKRRSRSRSPLKRSKSRHKNDNSESSDSERRKRHKKKTKKSKKKHYKR